MVRGPAAASTRGTGRRASGEFDPPPEDRATGGDRTARWQTLDEAASRQSDVIPIVGNARPVRARAGCGLGRAAIHTTSTTHTFDVWPLGIGNLAYGYRPAGAGPGRRHKPNN